MAKQVAKKPVDNKSAPKKTENKPAENKPAQKPTQPKAEQKPKEATKKQETKPVENVTPKQETKKNEKRKREENGTAPVHDVDKKVKEDPVEKTNVSAEESDVHKIVLTNLPDDVTIADIKQAFGQDLTVKIPINKDKARLGQALVYFSNAESFHQASKLKHITLGGEEVRVHVNPRADAARSVFVANFITSPDDASIHEFFAGVGEIHMIYYRIYHNKATTSFIAEFKDTSSKAAALAKNKTQFRGQTVSVVELKPKDPNAPKKESKKAPKKAPKKPAANKPAAKKPVAKKPVAKAPTEEKKAAPVKAQKTQAPAKPEAAAKPQTPTKTAAKKDAKKPAAKPAAKPKAQTKKN